MKKAVLILSFILVSVVSFAQRQRTTAMFDADTTTRPKTGFYGIGVRNSNVYFVPYSGTNIRLANYSLFTGLTTNYYVKWNGSKLVNTMMYGDGTNVGINTTSPGSLFDVRGQISASTGSLTNPAYSFVGDLNTGIYSSGADALALVTGGVNRLHINSSGSVGIGTTSLTGRSLSVSKDITGAVTSYAVLNNGTIKSDVTTSVRLFQTSLNTEAATFTIPTIYHYLALQNSIGAGSSITSQNGFYADASLVGAANNYGFRGAIAAATGRWNNYHDGTAQNYFAGNTGIGSGRSVPTTALDVNGQISVSLGSTSAPAYTFFGDLNNGWFSPTADTQAWSVGGSEVMRLSSAGSLGIGTTSLTGINLAIAKNITGGTVGYGININAVAQTDVTNTARYIRTLVSNASGGSMTDITHMYLGQGTLNSVTNQTGIWITSSLTGATNNYGIRNQVSSGTGRWGLFFDGSVQNHLRGNLGIGVGSTVPATELEVRGAISTSLGSTSAPAYTFVGNTNNGWYSPTADTQGWVLNGSEAMRLNSTGLGIGVTPAYKLDVNGEALIRDLLTINSTVTNEGGQVTLRNPTNYTKSFAIDNYQDSFRIINDTDGFTALSVNSSGSIAIGTTTANASSILDIPSTTKGVLLPRQTTTQINAISSPANGLMVYNTTLNKLCIYENGTWKQVTTTNM